MLLGSLATTLLLLTFEPSSLSLPDESDKRKHGIAEFILHHAGQHALINGVEKAQHELHLSAQHTPHHPPASGGLHFPAALGGGSIVAWALSGFRRKDRKQQYQPAGK